MIVDASAVLAIALLEPEARRLSDALSTAATRRISAVNWLECLMVIQGRAGVEGVQHLPREIAELGIQILAFDAEQARVAQLAFQRFGKGKHPAKLNLGDCCAYAAAMVAGEPLLYKGNDFDLTDVERAPY